MIATGVVDVDGAIAFVDVADVTAMAVTCVSLDVYSFLYLYLYISVYLCLSLSVFNCGSLSLTVFECV